MYRFTLQIRLLIIHLSLLIFVMTFKVFSAIFKVYSGIHCTAMSDRKFSTAHIQLSLFCCWAGSRFHLSVPSPCKPPSTFMSLWVECTKFCICTPLCHSWVDTKVKSYEGFTDQQRERGRVYNTLILFALVNTVLLCHLGILHIVFPLWMD